MTAAPIQFRWDGEAMIPVSRFMARHADKAFVIGEVYKLVEHHDRSDASHNHYFASIKNGFDSLPDHLRDEYPSTEHLRKKALIRKGYCLHRDHVCASKAEALRLRAFLWPMDEYAIIETRESVVRVYSAMSQSKKAMGAKDFQESKQAVLDFIDDLLGVEHGATAEARAA